MELQGRLLLLLLSRVGDGHVPRVYLTASRCHCHAWSGAAAATCVAFQLSMRIDANMSSAPRSRLGVMAHGTASSSASSSRLRVPVMPCDRSRWDGLPGAARCEGSTQQPRESRRPRTKHRHMMAAAGPGGGAPTLFPRALGAAAAAARRVAAACWAARSRRRCLRRAGARCQTTCAAATSCAPAGCSGVSAGAAVVGRRAAV